MHLWNNTKRNRIKRKSCTRCISYISYVGTQLGPYPVALKTQNPEVQLLQVIPVLLHVQVCISVIFDTDIRYTAESTYMRKIARGERCAYHAIHAFVLVTFAWRWAWEMSYTARLYIKGDWYHAMDAFGHVVLLRRMGDWLLVLGVAQPSCM